MMADNKENRAINTLLNEGVKFKIGIRVLGFKFRIPFRIKPLRLGTILYLSKQRLKVNEVSDEENILKEMFENADNLKPFARCIAVSVLNSRFKIKLFTYPLYTFFLWKLSVSEIHDLMSVVVTQMNARDFFLTTGLVKGIQIVDRKEKPNTTPKKQSGEQSAKSQKN